MPKSSTGSTSQRPSRQAEGLACDECRVRKLRCDRVRPTCGTCEHLGIPCTPNTSRQPRGPRKGHLKALQSRISALENQLLNGHPNPNAPPEPSNQPPRLASLEPAQSPGRQSDAESDQFQDQIEVLVNTRDPRDSQPPSDQPMVPTAARLEDLSALPGMPPTTATTATTTTSSSSSSSFPFPPIPSSLTSMLEHASPTDLLSDMMIFSSIPADFDTATFVPSKPSTNSSLAGIQPDATPSFGLTPPTFQMSELTKADLNHLYFDRVHLFAPILNRRRYFARAARPTDASAPFIVLQHAMWTLASWLGSQFKDMQRDLYTHTRALLERWEMDMAPESPPIELAQAWIFLAIYEIMQVDYDRGWLSAGRCFRLVQLMKLYEIDAPSGIEESDLSWVDLEERRRTFWMAYSLDRFINLINQMPLTLTEQVIFTRLPAPESAFQRERPIKTRFLSEVMTGGDDVERVSPFSACIVLMTISGRCLSHQQQCIVERAYGNMPQDFVTRHKWLEGILATKTKTMLASPYDDPDDELLDPMRLFASMGAHATTLLLGKAMQSVAWSCEDFVGGYEQRATEASQELCRLSQKLAEFGYFKIHPFTPIPLLFCAEFAQTRKARDPAFEAIYDSVLTSLRDLSAVSRLAEVCLAKFNAFDTEMMTGIGKSPV
ncbi:hypothetical protein OQA88_4344 [Cercophora sp. LCS_1]